MSDEKEYSYLPTYFQNVSISKAKRTENIIIIILMKRGEVQRFITFFLQMYYT
jgi:hypothetical protein